MSSHLRLVALTIGILEFSLINAICAIHGPINSEEAFAQALKTVRPGDSIIIADGNYKDWSFKLDSRGTKNQPISIGPESNHGVTFTGQSHFLILGSYIEISGF